MKKRFLMGLLSIFLLTGCTNAGADKQTTACTFSAAEGMDIQVKITAEEDTIRKMFFTITFPYEKLGYDLSEVSDSIKDSTASAILELLGLDADSNGITVKTKFEKEALVATGEINLDKAEDAVLETFGFMGVKEEELSLKKFLKDAQDSGVTCK
ncbi:MAG: DUF1307 domain-containing protein [Bacillota bacterium]|nr:DUF1307 domain-containing protein [Bacillota bacterium]